MRKLCPGDLVVVKSGTFLESLSGSESLWQMECPLATVIATRVGVRLVETDDGTCEQAIIFIAKEGLYVAREIDLMTPEESEVWSRTTTKHRLHE